MIVNLGPRGALERLKKPDAIAILEIMAGVGSARHEWLDVAAQLVPVSDGFAEQMLIAGLSMALEKDPVAVLERSSAGVPIDKVCAYDPLTPVSSTRTRADFNHALIPREQALERVTQTELSEVKLRCVNALSRLRTERAYLYEP
jgi:hypothetical protein